MSKRPKILSMTIGDFIDHSSIVFLEILDKVRWEAGYPQHQTRAIGRAIRKKVEEARKNAEVWKNKKGD